MMRRHRRCLHAIAIAGIAAPVVLLVAAAAFGVWLEHYRPSFVYTDGVVHLCEGCSVTPHRHRSRHWTNAWEELRAWLDPERLRREDRERWERATAEAFAAMATAERAEER